MGLLSFTNAVTVVFLIYVAHSISQFYVLFNPPLCTSQNPRDCYRVL